MRARERLIAEHRRSGNMDTCVQVVYIMKSRCTSDFVKSSDVLAELCAASHRPAKLDASNADDAPIRAIVRNNNYLY